MPGSAQLRHPLASNDPVGRIQLAYGRTPADRGVLWAAVSDAGLAAGRQPAGLDMLPVGLNATNTTFNGLYRSADDGVSWQVKATPQTLTGSPNSLLAAFGALGYGIGVQAYYNLWLGTDPTIPNQVYLGLEEVFQSYANAGSSPGPALFTTVQRYADLCGFLLYFQNITTGAPCPAATPIIGGISTHPDQHAAVIVHTSKSTRMYAGNDGGLFREDAHVVGSNGPDPLQVGFDNQHWTALNTISTTQPYHVALKPDGQALVALQDNGSDVVTKQGHGILVCGGDGIYVLSTPDPNVWYCTTPGALLYYTKDNGHTITAIPPGAVGDTGITGAISYSPVAIDPTDPRHLVAAGRPIEETVLGTDTKVLYDSAATSTILKTDWKTTYDPGTDGNVYPASGQHFNWTAVALAVRGPVIYDAVCGSCGMTPYAPPNLLLSTVVTNVKPGCRPRPQDAACWHVAAGKGLPREAISAVVIDPRDTRTIYVAVGSLSLEGYDPRQTGAERVLVSHDAGEHFSDLTANLPGGPMHGLVYRDGQLIVVGDVGVFTAPASGGQWRRLGSGLPTGVMIRDAYIEPTGRKMLVAAYGRGAWEFDFGTPAQNNNSPSGPKRGRGSLATTGSPAMLALLALLFTLSAVVLRRRRAPTPATLAPNRRFRGQKTTIRGRSDPSPSDSQVPR
jgi:hypothetical protein